MYHVNVNTDLMVEKCNLNQKWNNDKCLSQCQNLNKHRVCKKGCFWNLEKCSCKNGKYAGSIGNSVAKCN